MPRESQVVVDERECPSCYRRCCRCPCVADEPRVRPQWASFVVPTGVVVEPNPHYCCCYYHRFVVVGRMVVDSSPRLAAVVDVPESVDDALHCARPRSRKTTTSQAFAERSSSTTMMMACWTQVIPASACHREETATVGKRKPTKPAKRAAPWHQSKRVDRLLCCDWSNV